MAGAVLRWDVVEVGEGSTFRLWACRPSGEDLVASWVLSASSAWPVVAERSPDRSRVAVAVGRCVWVVDVASGTVAGPVTADASCTGSGGASWGAFSWETVARPVLVRPGSASRTRTTVGDGWTVDLDGPAEDDGGVTPASVGSARLLFEPDVTQDERDDAWLELWSQEERAAHPEVEVRCVAERDGVEVTVLEETARLVQGAMRVHWPPIVATGHGILVRRCRHTTTPGDWGFSTTYEPQRPCVVRVDGSVQEVPIELGVSPLCGMPDGTFLMPGDQPGWVEGDDSPLHTLDVDGGLTPLMVAGAPLTPSRILDAVAPHVPREDPSAVLPETWMPHAASVEQANNRLRVLLFAPYAGEPVDHPAWIAVSVRLDPDVRLDADDHVIELLATGQSTMPRAVLL